MSDWGSCVAQTSSMAALLMNETSELYDSTIVLGSSPIWDGNVTGAADSDIRVGTFVSAESATEIEWSTAVEVAS